MDNYDFSWQDMISMFARGIYIGTITVLIVYFAFMKKERQKYHLCFAIACSYLAISVLLNMVSALLHNTFGQMALTVEELWDLSAIPFFVTFVYCLVRQPKIWYPLAGVFLGSEMPFLLGSLCFRLTRNVYISQILVVYSVVFVLVCLLQTIQGIKHYHLQLENSYAALTSRRLDWIYRVLGLLLSLFVFYLVLEYFFGNHLGGLIESLYLLLSLTCLYLIAWCLSRQTPVDMDILDATDKAKEDEEVDREDVMDQIEERLRAKFEDTHTFTDNDVNIRQTARLLGVNIRQLSAYLNDRLNMSYVQYVNQLRISMACQILETEDSVQVDELVDRTGFGASSTFFRLFKLQTGVSPNEYCALSREKRVVAPVQEVEVQQDTTTVQSEAMEQSSAPVQTEPLTPREQVLAGLIRQGLSNEEICQRMNVTTRSLRVMRSRLRQKLNLERKDSLAQHLGRE